jgi:hypothetical protein
LARYDEGELSEQALRVLDDADDLAGLAALPPDVPDLEAEGRRQARGHRDLAGIGRVVPAEQREHRLPERAAGVLGAQFVGVDGAGNGDGLVLDNVDAAKAMLQRGDLGGQVRSGRLERGQVSSGTEPRVGRGRRGRGHRRPDDRGGHRDHDERQDQQLLAPLPAEQPPGPADHRAAGGSAPVRGPRLRRAFLQRRAHWL